MFFSLFYCWTSPAHVHHCTILVQTLLLHCPFSLVGSTLRLSRSEQLVRLSAASKVIVTTPLYGLPITPTKEMWQAANPGCVRHRWESLLPLLIDWEENSLNSIFHLSQSRSKLSSPLDCPPVGEGVADATLDALLLLNKCPIAS